MENVRLIHSVDKVSNLRTLVKQDLRELGIKVPKSKKTKKLNYSRNSSQDGMLNANIFGNYLSFVPSSYIPDCGFIPTFLVDAAEIIEENCEVEGIFRKTGSINRQKELRQQLEGGQELKSASVHDVSALIKQFFRELPEPLLTSVFHDCFVRCYHLPQPDQMEAMLLLCLLLPPEHLSVLRFTMGLLSRLAAHSAHNKMDVGNLAVVLAPNIMHVNSRSQKMTSTEEKLLQLQTAIVELLICNASRLGIVSESLFQRTTLMTECFGTDNELDASDDNTLEDSKDAKEVRKKRRKRSSSLQGLVSSIGRSIAKLRRSTDGKNNLTSTSQMILSNESGMMSQSQSMSKTQEMGLPPSTPAATPVVMRKRKASGEGVPFSATKKKAILEQLPQRTVLGATPFTPASTRRPDTHDARLQNPLDTPSIAFTGKSQIEFSATPSHDSKTPRKKLGLFSPSSKSKRKSSTTNLCSNPLRKSSKTKHIFKRLSGSREKDLLEKDTVGKRLASPTGVPHSESAMELDNMMENSPMGSLAMMHSTSSTSLHNASLVTSVSISNALDQGFIAPDDNEDLDVTHNTLASLTSASPSSAPERGRMLNRADSHCPSQRPVRRSNSADGAMHRGDLNTISNGLLEGKKEKVTKLRGSFDKSDISCPIPIIVPTLPEKVTNADNCKQNGSHGEGSQIKESVPTEAEKGESAGKGVAESPADETREEGGMESSLLDVVLPPPTGFTDQTMMESVDGEAGSDTESDTGFSTISGGTIIHNPPAKPSKLDSLQADFRVGPRSMVYYGSSVSVNMPPSLLQSSTSVDSLYSSASDGSMTSSSTGSKMLERSFSVDSGKGSLVDNAEVVKQKHEERHLNITFTKSSPPHCFSNAGSSVNKDSKAANLPAVRSIKSVSAEDLKSRAKAERPAARSNSMFVAGFGRHVNIIPNLQISAETHKLLRRAGFLEDGDLPPNVKDVSLPARSPKKSASHSFHLNRSDQRSLSLRSHECSIALRESSSKEDVWVKAETCDKRVDKEPTRHALEPMEEEVLDVPVTKHDTHKSAHSQHQSLTSHPPVMSLKRAEMRMQKHKSVLQIKESNAGRVAANIRQINSSLEVEHTTLDLSDASLHFPACTTRKRGVSPIRIPTIFANTDKKAEYYRSLAQKAVRRQVDQSDSDVSLDSTRHGDQSSRVQQGNVDESKHHETMSNKPMLQSFSGQDSELSTSLMETIEDVITPRSQRQHIHASRSPLQEFTSNISSGLSSHLEKGITYQQRMSKGLTPHQVLHYGPVSGCSKRSPGKPVKRLQSPHSPSKFLRSPEKPAHDVLHLTSFPNQTFEKY